MPGKPRRPAIQTVFIGRRHALNREEYDGDIVPSTEMDIDEGVDEEGEEVDEEGEEELDGEIDEEIDETQPVASDVQAQPQQEEESDGYSGEISPKTVPPRRNRNFTTFAPTPRKETPKNAPASSLKRRREENTNRTPRRSSRLIKSPAQTSTNTPQSSSARSSARSNTAGLLRGGTASNKRRKTEDDRRRRSKAPSIPSERLYEVESILGTKIDPETLEHFYLIKWKGYAHKDNSWEPKLNLTQCEDAIREFEQKQLGGQGKRGTRGTR